MATRKSSSFELLEEVQSTSNFFKDVTDVSRPAE